MVLERTFMQRRTFLAHSGRFMLAAATFPTLKAADFTKVKIGYLPITDHLVLIAKELYPDSFTAVKFSSWAELSEALRSGSIDAAFILTPLALKLASDGLKIKALMAAHRDGSALTVKKGLIKSASELKGKKIAIPSRFSTHFLLLSELLKNNQIKIDEVSLVDMAPPEMPFALQSGQIEAFIVAEPFGVIAQNAGFGETLIFSGDIQKNHICCIFVANENLAQNKEQAQTLLNHFIKAAHLGDTDANEASKLAQKVLGHKPNIIKQVIENKELIQYTHLRLEKADIDKVLEQVSEFKVGTFNVSYENFVDNSFIDALLKA